MISEIIMMIFNNVVLQIHSIILCYMQKEHIQDDGSTVVHFPNGTKKVTSPDGLSSTVYFFNGDTKRVESDGTIVSDIYLAMKQLHNQKLHLYNCV